MTANERRRFERIRPSQPIPGSVGRARIYVLDGSIGGLGILHENVLPSPGDLCRVEVQSDVGPITLDCEVVRTIPHSSGIARPLSESGLRVVAADHQSAERLRITFSARAQRGSLDN